MTGPKTRKREEEEEEEFSSADSSKNDVEAYVPSLGISAKLRSRVNTHQGDILK